MAKKESLNDWRCCKRRKPKADGWFLVRHKAEGSRVFSLFYAVNVGKWEFPLMSLGLILDPEYLDNYEYTGIESYEYC